MTEIVTCDCGQKNAVVLPLAAGRIARCGACHADLMPTLDAIVDPARVCDDPECQRFPNRCDHVGVRVREDWPVRGGVDQPEDPDDSDDDEDEDDFEDDDDDEDSPAGGDGDDDDEDDFAEPPNDPHVPYPERESDAQPASPAPAVRHVVWPSR